MFVSNASDYGGVFDIRDSNNIIITIYKCSFQNKEAFIIGGVAYFSNSTSVVITKSVDYSNKARQYADALYFTSTTNAHINFGEFHDNSAVSIDGSLFLHGRSRVYLTGTISFIGNSAIL